MEPSVWLTSSRSESVRGSVAAAGAMGGKRDYDRSVAPAKPPDRFVGTCPRQYGTVVAAAERACVRYLNQARAITS